MKTLPRLLAAVSIAAAMGVRAENPAKVTADQAPPAQWPAMAEAGDPLAQALLARAYFYGTDGMDVNPKTADAWARRSAGQNHPLGLFLRGWCCYFDLLRPEAEREQEAKPFFEQALAAGFEKQAGQGGRQWLAMLGLAHGRGCGMSENREEAVKCWRKAADLGDPNAMASLGVACHLGIGVPKDEGAAFQWYRKAAALGEANAMAFIGNCYRFGIEVEKNEAAAVEWNRKAADRGSYAGMFGLGDCYLQGIGVPKDEAEGVKWLRKAADVGDCVAMAKLGDFSALSPIPSGGRCWCTANTALTAPEPCAPSIASQFRIGPRRKPSER